MPTASISLTVIGTPCTNQIPSATVAVLVGEVLKFLLISLRVVAIDASGLAVGLLLTFMSVSLRGA